MIKAAFGVKTDSAPANYRYQLFVSENGRIYRYKRRFGKISKDEFCYIHFRKETPIMMKDVSCPNYIISGNGFIEIDTSVLMGKARFSKLVDLYNHRDMWVIDKVNVLKYYFKKIFHGK